MWGTMRGRSAWTMTGKPQTDAASKALRHYTLDVRRMLPLYAGWNTFYQVEAAGGARYALRLGRPGTRDLTVIWSELVWLEALRRDTDICVPEPIRTRDGETICTVTTADETAYHCVLFRWIEGQRPASPPSLQTVRLLGETMARLHRHADIFQPPADFTTLRLDSGRPTVQRDLLYSDEPHPLLTPWRRRFLREVAARFQSDVDALYADPSGLRFLHTDLHPGNVLVHRGRMAVLDFDSSLWCYPIQDVGITLYALEWHAPGEMSRRTFREGYEGVRGWPETWEGQVEPFVVAQALDLLCFFLMLEEERFLRHAESTLRRLETRLAWREC